jgi:hypothetical protein
MAPASVLYCEQPVESGIASCMQPSITACRCSLNTQQESRAAGHTQIESSGDTWDSPFVRRPHAETWQHNRLTPKKGCSMVSRSAKRLLLMAHAGPTQCIMCVSMYVASMVVGCVHMTVCPKQ